MAKWYGVIGYVEQVQTAPGVWTEEPVERKYFGDIIQMSLMHQSAGQVNDNINISNTFSIIADPYADAHLGSMRYLIYKGTKWKITNIKDQYPRLLLTVGGVYNG